MRELFEQVLSSYLTERARPFSGSAHARLIRETLPENIARSANLRSSEFLVVGSPGKGNWAEIPWVSIFDTSITRSAEQGYYIVYLFDATLRGFYLSLNQGWTQYERKYGAPIARTRIRQTARRLQGLLKSTLSDFTFSPIDLHATNVLGRGYMVGHICGKWYGASNVPSDSELINDLRNLIGVYRELKGQVGTDIFHLPRLTRVSGDAQTEMVESDRESNEVNEVISKIEEVAGKKQSRPGRIMSSELRKAIEAYSMAIAAQAMREAGWEPEDVSASNPFDIRCRRGNEVMAVEVKGTTSSGTVVALTPNEIDYVSANYPGTALIIVHNIVIDEHGQPTAGKIRQIAPWEIDDAYLKPLAFSYKIPPEL